MKYLKKFGIIIEKQSWTMNDFIELERMEKELEEKQSIIYSLLTEYLKQNVNVIGFFLREDDEEDYLDIYYGDDDEKIQIGETEFITISKDEFDNELLPFLQRNR